MPHPDLPPPVAALLEPAFYPEPPEAVELVETHISWVFLAGALAYKVRKPVRFPFLDYGDEDRRHRLAREEIRLGRRLAPDVYRGVRAIAARDGGGYVLAEEDAAGAVEHIVEMRRFDRNRTLAALLERGEASADEVRRVARRLASFHAEAEHVANAWDAAAVAATVDADFSALLPYGGELGAGAVAAGRRFATSFVQGHRDLLDARAAAGLVRDGHGDLRAEHVLLEDGIEIVDPVEFDPALRQIDVSADFAFLVMELSALGATELAEVLADEYTAAGGDHGGTELLQFYAAWRAWIRCKVACIRADELGPGADRDEKLRQGRELAGLAVRLAWRARQPIVLVVCGRAASGKSSLAEELSRRSGLPVLSSDIVRKELVGVAARERAGEAAYSEQASLQTYAELGRRAAVAGSAIVDATFRRRTHRDAFAAAYGAAAPAPLYVECVAPEAVLAARGRRRELDDSRVSDADAAIVARQAAELEPLDEVPDGRRLLLRTDRAVGAAADDVEAWLDERLSRT